MPVFNRKDITRRCLVSLHKQTSSEFKIILIDDGSTDGTSEMAENDFPNVILLKGDGNLWWTGGTNMGLEHALKIASNDDYIMLLNDDLVVDEDFIEIAHHTIAKHPNTLIQAVEMDVDNKNTILNGGWKINWLTAKFFQLNTNKKITTFKSGHYEAVMTQTGRGTLIPITVLKHVGLYNAVHYPQCGDFEYPVRASHFGYNLIMHYDLRIYSFVEQTCDMNLGKQYSLKDILSYYGNIRSYAYLPSRFWFAYDTATNPIKGTVFLFFDLLRTTSRFIRNLKFTN